MQSITTSNGFTMRTDVAGLQSALLTLASRVNRIAGTKLPPNLKAELYRIASDAKSAVFVAQAIAEDRPEANLDSESLGQVVEAEKSSFEYGVVPE